MSGASDGRPALVVDSREQNPLDLRPYGWPTITAGLKTGDYSLVGMEDIVAVERKSLPDCLACIGRERARFERELERLAAFKYPALLIEADLTDILAGHERSKVHPRAAIGSLVSWSVQYRIPVWFAHDRRHAAALLIKIMEKAAKHLKPAAPAPAA